MHTQLIAYSQLFYNGGTVLISMDSLPCEREIKSCAHKSEQKHQVKYFSHMALLCVYIPFKRKQSRGKKIMQPVDLIFIWCKPVKLQRK